MSSARNAFRTSADRASFALFAMAVLIAVAALLYMLAARRNLGFAALLADAAVRSDFSPTVFEMYDRSTSDVCDRLIVVQPFEWYVWCCRGRLLVLNPEGGIRCDAGKMPAVRVTASSEFVETCVDANLATILDLYRNTGVYFRVPYDIPKGTKTFTILSALNALASEWIEIRDDVSSDEQQQHSVQTANAVETGGSGDRVDGTTPVSDLGAPLDRNGRPLVRVLPPVDPRRGDSREKRSVSATAQQPTPATSQRKHGVYGRWLTASEMERVVRPPLGRASNRDHNSLLEAYRMHVYGPGNS